MINRDRVLTKIEQETWDHYEAVLDLYNNRYNVRCYDRVSVHNAFPEIKTAFEKCRSMNTYYHLTKDYENEDSD